MSGLNTNENIEDAILFDVKTQALTDLTLSQHINRLTNMGDFLVNAINNNRENLNKLKESSRLKLSELQTAYHMLQSQTKAQLERMKNVFEPSMNIQRKQLSDMKNQVSKVNAEQLSTKKNSINCEAIIDHCENQMGYVEIRSNRNRQ